MEDRNDLVQRLLNEDEEFKKAYKTHQDYESRLAKMERKPRLSADETIEKKRLKKLKLALKDEMERRISEYAKQG